MRKVVMGVMTTLDGRLDDPNAWMTEVPDDLYAEIDRRFETFDTILVGRTTYEEMFEYWPGAETAEGGSEIGKSMARKMNRYTKYVFSGANDQTQLEWENAELVLAHGDGDVTRFVNDLKSRSGGDIHLAGGAQLAQTCVRLGLVDEYRLYVWPVVSPGSRWFDPIDARRHMRLTSTTAYSHGVVGLYYEAD
jgi:dihydrofolate reductase